MRPLYLLIVLDSSSAILRLEKTNTGGSTAARSIFPLLLAYDRMLPQTISARRWKLDMGLNGKGKDGSRELAVQLFPQSADLLKCDGLTAKSGFSSHSRSWLCSCLCDLPSVGHFLNQPQFALTATRQACIAHSLLSGDVPAQLAASVLPTPTEVQMPMPGGCFARRRKKDHGRAEALLIAAWSANMRQQPLAVTSKSAGDASDAVQMPAQEDSISSAAEQCLTILADMCAEAAKKPVAGAQHSDQHAGLEPDPTSTSRQSEEGVGAEADMSAAPMDPDEFAAWKEAVKQQMIDSVAPSQRERVAAVLNAYKG